MAQRFRTASEKEVERDWREFTGGGPVVGILRQYEASDVQGLIWDDESSGHRGLVSWWVDGERAEIVSVHAEPTGGAIGTRLMDAAEDELRRCGVMKVVLATTNDNVRALNFYLKRGYRLVRVHLDAMDAVRRVKPAVPEIGRDGIPLRDMWEVEKDLLRRVA
ncbi:MAG: GNAT family N-acetyltransferase [Chloroflexi bacterium]|nr:GNAT family N-acetyltransferase [Chloroflexota bacterium]